MENNIFVCKTLRLMNYLVKNGFDCKKVRRDRYDNDYIVFVFENSTSLQECLSKYNKQ